MNREIENKELEIIKAVLNGEKEEFRFLVREHQDMIYSMILRQVGNQALAEDLTQETFIKAYSKLKQYRSEAKFSTWLVRIALNTTNSHLSSRKHKNQLLHDQLDFKQIKNENEDSLNQKLEMEIKLKKLKFCIQKLKPEFRDAITLCALEQKSYEEASEILNVPIGTVRSRLNRARKQIQKQFAEI